MCKYYIGIQGGVGECGNVIQEVFILRGHPFEDIEDIHTGPATLAYKAASREDHQEA